MAIARTLLSRRFHSLLHPQNVPFISHILTHSNPPPPSSHRPFASSSQTLADSDQTHAFKSLHSIFQQTPQRRNDSINEKVKGKSRKGETLGLLENTGDKERKVGSFKNVKMMKKKKSRETLESKVSFVQDEINGNIKQGKAVILSEQSEVQCVDENTEDKESKVGNFKNVNNKKKKKKKKVNFVEDEVNGKIDQGRAVNLSEESEVQCEEGKKKKLEKKLKRPKKMKVIFVEEAEEEEKKPEPKRRLYDIFNGGKKLNETNTRRLMGPVIADTETHEEVKQKEPAELKKLSMEMETLLSYLYKEGYFWDANFIKGKHFDVSWFDSEFARNYTLSAVRKFGKDKQEISKWLSGSDLKQVAMFGCPSAIKAQVFSSKRLRYYFKIPENTVCGKCVLRDSCKFVNQSIWKTGNHLDLAAAMKVICSYAMSLLHPQVVVPDKVNNSVNRLLKEVLKLSQTL